VFLNKSISMAGNISDDFDKSAVLLKILDAETEIGNQFKDKKLLDERGIITKGITKEYYKTLASKESNKS